MSYRGRSQSTRPRARAHAREVGPEPNALSAPRNDHWGGGRRLYRPPSLTTTTGLEPARSGTGTPGPTRYRAGRSCPSRGHMASPVTVIETRRLLVIPPRKCGPPESPKQVPPLPVDGFMFRFSHAGCSESSVCWATSRFVSSMKPCGPRASSCCGRCRSRRQ